MNKVFLYLLDNRHLSRAIMHVECTVITCKKTVWAERGDGRRFLMGSSAFCTRIAALRVQEALLDARVKNRGFAILEPGAYARCKKRLDLVRQEILH